MPDRRESGYKGLVKIDSFNVAIYDEEDVVFDLYKDSLHIEPFTHPEKRKNIEKDSITMHMIVPGQLKNNKFETILVAEIIEKNWIKYFK